MNKESAFELTKVLKNKLENLIKGRRHKMQFEIKAYKQKKTNYLDYKEEAEK